MNMFIFVYNMVAETQSYTKFLQKVIFSKHIVF